MSKKEAIELQKKIIEDYRNYLDQIKEERKQMKEELKGSPFSERINIIKEQKEKRDELNVLEKKYNKFVDLHKEDITNIKNGKLSPEQALMKDIGKDVAHPEQASLDNLNSGIISPEKAIDDDSGQILYARSVRDGEFEIKNLISSIEESKVKEREIKENIKGLSIKERIMKRESYRIELNTLREARIEMKTHLKIAEENLNDIKLGNVSKEDMAANDQVYNVKKAIEEGRFQGMKNRVEERERRINNPSFKEKMMDKHTMQTYEIKDGEVVTVHSMRDNSSFEKFRASLNNVKPSAYSEDKIGLMSEDVSEAERLIEEQTRKFVNESINNMLDKSNLGNHFEAREGFSSDSKQAKITELKPTKNITTADMLENRNLPEARILEKVLEGQENKDYPNIRIFNVDETDAFRHKPIEKGVEIFDDKMGDFISIENYNERNELGTLEERFNGSAAKVFEEKIKGFYELAQFKLNEKVLDIREKMDGVRIEDLNEDLVRREADFEKLSRESSYEHSEAFYKKFKNDLHWDEVAKNHKITPKIFMENKEMLSNFKNELLNNEKVDERLRTVIERNNIERFAVDLPKKEKSQDKHLTLKEQEGMEKLKSELGLNKIGRQAQMSI